MYVARARQGPTFLGRGHDDALGHDALVQLDDLLDELRAAARLTVAQPQVLVPAARPTRRGCGCCSRHARVTRTRNTTNCGRHRRARALLRGWPDPGEQRPRGPGPALNQLCIQRSGCRVGSAPALAVIVCVAEQLGEREGLAVRAARKVRRDKLVRGEKTLRAASGGSVRAKVKWLSHVVRAV
jgi:hypothetical protein